MGSSWGTRRVKVSMLLHCDVVLFCVLIDGEKSLATAVLLVQLLLLVCWRLTVYLQKAAQQQRIALFCTTCGLLAFVQR